MPTCYGVRMMLSFTCGIVLFRERGVCCILLGWSWLLYRMTIFRGTPNPHKQDNRYIIPCTLSPPEARSPFLFLFTLSKSQKRTKKRPKEASPEMLEEKYGSHDLHILAPAVKDLVTAFSISSDAAWLDTYAAGIVFRGRCRGLAK